MVLVWHYVVVFEFENMEQLGPSDIPLLYLAQYLDFTWSGVDLFFVLSGFLIGGILIDNRGAGSFFSTFYARRVCRIFPLYYLSLLVFFLAFFTVPASFLEWLLGDAFGWLFAQPLPAWAYVTMTQNLVSAYQGAFGPLWLAMTWSLAVEEQFYLTLPLLVWFVSGKRLPFLLAGLALAAPLLRTAIASQIDVQFSAQQANIATYMLMACRADSLLLGVLCACVVRNDACISWLRTHTKALYGVFVSLAVTGTSLVLLRVGELALGPFLPEMYYYGYSWLALLYSCILLIAVTERRGIVTFITRRPSLGWLGVIAFGVYLFHQPVLGILHGLILGQQPHLHTWSDLAVTLGALVITLVLASVSWIFFEKRVLDWGRRSFRYKKASSTPLYPERHP